MRINVAFRSEKDILLSVSYNHILQALIYNNIDEKLANFLHDKGFMLGKRSFKLFTFSRLSGKIKFIPELKSFKISPPFKLTISSPVENFLSSLAENFIKSERLNLNGEQIFVESINVFSIPKLNSEVTIRILSPVTMYSTLKTLTGKKKTYYYSPFENEFSELLEENLKKKYEVLYKAKPNSLSFSIEPIGVSKKDEKIIDYKGTVIKGWMGRYRLKGSPELIKLAYDAGLGAKNSQGFGCFEIIKGERND